MIDVLVPNAAYQMTHESLDEISDEGWDCHWGGYIWGARVADTGGGQIPWERWVSNWRGSGRDMAAAAPGRMRNMMFTFTGHPDDMHLSRMISRVAAITAAALALVATISAAAAVPFASTEVLVSELWRTVGLATWVALFVLLAISPRLLPLWVIALSSKIALVISGFAIGLGTPGASDLVLWDGILSLVLAIGLISCVRMRAVDRESRYLPGPG